MEYKRKGTVEAIKWFPKREYDGAFDPAGVEYTDSGWFFAGIEIQPGEIIICEGGNEYVMTEAEFNDEFELVETEEV